MNHLSNILIDVVDDDDLAEPWLDKGKVYPVPVFKKGKHPYTIPIVEPATVYYRNNPYAGGFVAHVKFRFLKEKDGEDDFLSRFLNNHCKLSFVITNGCGKTVLHTEDFDSCMKLCISPFSMYVDVHATVGPLLYTHCRMDMEELMKCN